MLSDAEAIAVKTIELLPEIIEKKPELAYRMFEILKRHFVPVEIFKEIMEKLDKRLETLEMDVRELRRDVETLGKDMKSVKASLDRLMVSLEEEAQSWVRHLLKKHGIEMNVRREFVGDMEIDIFGESDDIVLVGDATVRAGRGVIEWIHNRARKISRLPRFAGKKFIVIIYAMHYTPEAIELAKKFGVWLIRSGVEVSKFQIIAFPI